jgi:hypothetical protein
MSDTEYDTSDTEYDTDNEEEEEEVEEEEETDTSIAFRDHLLLDEIPLHLSMRLTQAKNCDVFKRKLEELSVYELSHFVLINYWRNHPHKQERIDFSDGLYVIKEIKKTVIHCDFYPILDTPKSSIRNSVLKVSGVFIRNQRFDVCPSHRSLKMSSIFNHPNKSGFGIFNIIELLDNGDRSYLDKLADIDDCLSKPFMAFKNEYGFIPSTPFIALHERVNNKVMKHLRDERDIRLLLDIFVALSSVPKYRMGHKVSGLQTLSYRKYDIRTHKQLIDGLYIWVNGINDGEYDIEVVIDIIIELTEAEKGSQLYEGLQYIKQSRKTTYESYHSAMFKLISKI